MTSGHEQVTINDQGRVVLPARLRNELGLGAGSTLIAYVEDGRLILETRSNAARRVRAMVRSQARITTSVVDELLADRRAEAERESR